MAAEKLTFGADKDVVEYIRKTYDARHDDRTRMAAALVESLPISRNRLSFACLCNVVRMIDDSNEAVDFGIRTGTRLSWDECTRLVETLKSDKVVSFATERFCDALQSSVAEHSETPADARGDAELEPPSCENSDDVLSWLVSDKREAVRAALLLAKKNGSAGDHKKLMHDMRHVVAQLSCDDDCFLLGSRAAVAMKSCDRGKIAEAWSFPPILRTKWCLFMYGFNFAIDPLKSSQAQVNCSHPSSHFHQMLLERACAGE